MPASSVFPESASPSIFFSSDNRKVIGTMNMENFKIAFGSLLPLGFWGKTTDLTPVIDAAWILAAGGVLASLIWGISLVIQAKIKYRK